MKIFLSWSGDLSKALAEALKDWIESVIQAAEVFYSPHDIGKGSRWNNNISQELENTAIGLIILTEDNLESSWIMFEAGALSKNVESSKVVPVLFNVHQSQIVGPLTQFQTATFSKEEIYRTITMINEVSSDKPLSSTKLRNQFELLWPKFNARVDEILKVIPPTKKAHKRTLEDMLEEMLSLSRNIQLNMTEIRKQGQQTEVKSLPFNPITHYEQNNVLDDEYFIEAVEKYIISNGLKAADLTLDGDVRKLYFTIMRKWPERYRAQINEGLRRAVNTIQSSQQEE